MCRKHLVTAALLALVCRSEIPQATEGRRPFSECVSEAGTTTLDKAARESRTNSGLRGAYPTSKHLRVGALLAQAEEAPGVTLLWDAPTQVVAGREFATTIAMSSDAAAPTARLLIAYDPQVLQPIDCTILREGIIGVDVQGPVAAGASVAPVELRFRVLTAQAAATQLRVDSASAVDFTGAPLVVTIPSVQTLNIVTN
jgi:hypothetical protein